MTSAAIITVLLIVLLLLKVPVGIAMLAPSILYIWFSPMLSMGVVVQRFMEGVNNYVLLAIPLFILMGNLLNNSGVTDRLFDFLESLTSRVRGGLGYANVGASLIFSGMSGSALADTAGLGTIEIEAMKKRGYDMPFAVGITGASAIIGPIFPPSIPAVVYGVASGVSIGGLFIGGVVPAFLLAGALCVMVFFIARRRGYKLSEQISIKEILKSFWRSIPALAAPVLLLAGMFSGLFTPTEAAGVVVCYAAVLGFVLYRSLKISNVVEILKNTVVTSVQVLFIVGAASLFAWILAYEEVPLHAAQALLGLTQSPAVFLGIVVLLLLIVGMFLAPNPAILILVPVLLPALNAYGISPLHFGIIMIVTLMIGLLTPPVGTVLYVLQSVTKMSLRDIVKSLFPFMLPLVVILIAVTYIPWLSVGLPALLGYR